MSRILPFIFEKLDVYQKAVDFAEGVACLTEGEGFPRGYGFLVDQLDSRLRSALRPTWPREMAASPRLIAETPSRSRGDRYRSVSHVCRSPGGGRSNKEPTSIAPKEQA